MYTHVICIILCTYYFSGVLIHTINSARYNTKKSNTLSRAPIIFSTCKISHTILSNRSATARHRTNLKSRTNKIFMRV